MVFAVLIAVVVVLQKKVYRYLPVVCFAFLYGLSNLIITFGILYDTVVYDIAKVVNVMSLVALLCVTIWSFLKSGGDARRKKWPLLFCVGLVADRVIDRALYSVSSMIYILTGSTVGIDNLMLALHLVLDIIHLVLGVSFAVSVIVHINRVMNERET